MSALDDVRRAALNNLRAQAQQRVQATAEAHVPMGQTSHQGVGPAQQAMLNGNDQQAASLWTQHHPGAVSRGQIPGWVMHQDAKTFQGVPGTANGMQNPGIQRIGGMVPHGNQNILPILPSNTARVEHQAGPFVGNGNVHALLHLGQGLFINPSTGELHGFGNPGGFHPPGSVMPAPTPQPRAF